MLLVLLAPLAFGDEEGGLLGEWKQNLASPTYGIALTRVEIDSADGGNSQEIWLPGLDLRIFRGVNVSKRGGFFAGVEVGTLFFFFIPEEKKSFSDSYGSSPYNYTVEINMLLANVFLLAKYGYRLDLGISLVGVSLGAELGIGACISQGNFRLETNIDSLYYGENSFESNTMGMGVMLDAALEAAVRFGKNFRIIARLGAVITPPAFSGGNRSDFWTAAAASELNVINSSAKANALLARYTVSQLPVIPTARLGFILNY